MEEILVGLGFSIFIILLGYWKFKTKENNYKQ